MHCNLVQDMEEYSEMPISSMLILYIFLEPDSYWLAYILGLALKPGFEYCNCT